MLVQRRYLVWLVLVSIMVTTGSLSAGVSDDSVLVGQRVRVHLDTVISERFMLFFSLKHNETRKIVGHLASYTNDSITIVTDFPLAERRTISTESIKRLDYVSGTIRRTWKGIWIGATCGTVLTLGSLMGAPAPPDYERPPLSRIAVTFIGGCTLLGAIIGWNINHDAWTEAKKDKLPWGLDVQVADGGLQLHLSHSFP